MLPLTPTSTRVNLLQLRCLPLWLPLVAMQTQQPPNTPNPSRIIRPAQGRDPTPSFSQTLPPSDHQQVPWPRTSWRAYRQFCPSKRRARTPRLQRGTRIPATASRMTPVDGGSGGFIDVQIRIHHECWLGRRPMGGRICPMVPWLAAVRSWRCPPPALFLRMEAGWDRPPQLRLWGRVRGNV